MSNERTDNNFEPTELEIADQFVDRYGADLRYCPALGGWLRWTGTHWAPDNLEHARECAKSLAQWFATRAAKLLDLKGFKTAKRTASAVGVRHVLELARSAPGIIFAAEDADADPWLLNAENGTVDLRTGELRPHNRDDLITRVCPTDYDPGAKSPTFERFLCEVLPDQDIREYVARFIGYSAFGIVREHILGVFWGPGANGKSVLTDVVTHVLGDYAKPGPSSLIVQNGVHEPHPTDVASCVGTRLVVVHETKRGASFDASKIKLLTGGDKLTARFMRQDYFSFQPSHTLLMLSNYKPQADATDAALWRRVQLVPFDVVVPTERRDTELAEKIKAESAGVLNWVVRGAAEWLRIGLCPPQAVKEQTEAYRLSEDVVGAFINERCVKLPAASIRAQSLYAGYKSFCDEQGARPVRRNDFAAEISARGFRKRRDKNGNIYLGIGLHTSDV